MAPDARIVSLKVGTADGGVDVTPGDRGDRLGRPARERPGLQHPRDQPLLRDELDAGLRGRPARLRRRAGVEEGHRRRRGRGQHRLPEGQDAHRARQPGIRPVRDRVSAATTTWERRASPTTRSATTRPARPAAASCKNPDFVADGSHMQGLRVPNGYIDATHPEGGSTTATSAARGTSQATAIAAGCDRARPAEVPESEARSGEAVHHRQREEDSGEPTPRRRAAARSRSTSWP